MVPTWYAQWLAASPELDRMDSGRLARFLCMTSLAAERLDLKFRCEFSLPTSRYEWDSVMFDVRVDPECSVEVGAVQIAEKIALNIDYRTRGDLPESRLVHFTWFLLPHEGFNYTPMRDCVYTCAMRLK